MKVQIRQPQQLCSQVKNICWNIKASHLADLTASKRPGTSYQIEIYFAVVNHLYLLFSFVKLVET